jgi:hypothetical protein
VTHRLTAPITKGTRQCRCKSTTPLPTSRPIQRKVACVIGLSVDTLQDHGRWASDIAKSQGTAPNYPIIGDHDLVVAKLYNMLPVCTSGVAAKRTATDNQTVRKTPGFAPPATSRAV